MVSDMIGSSIEKVVLTFRCASRPRQRMPKAKADREDTASRQHRPLTGSPGNMTRRAFRVVPDSYVVKPDVGFRQWRLPCAQPMAIIVLYVARGSDKVGFFPLSGISPCCAKR